MPELYQFVVLTDVGFRTEQAYYMPMFADQHYEVLCMDPINRAVYYYAASNGGLVNAYHQPGFVR